MKRLPVIILGFLTCFSHLASAQLSDKQIEQIDSLFRGWNQPNHPGGVIGVRIGDNTVYQKAYGLASLEYLTPNQTSTIFNLASVSKQFTAMGILILEQQGKLSVDDKISKFIPNLTDIGDQITIRHMLHHTSGIRSFHELLWYAGWRWNDYRTNEDIYRLMTKQEDLNFKPGDEYMYCNTGYIYMAYIIEQLTDEDFTTWMQNNVFGPLGLRNTYVEDNPARIVPQNATSYFGNSKSGFERALDYWAYVGSGNMHSNVEDLMTWGSNFYNPQKGWEGLFKRLQTTDSFNDGTPNNYAFGVNVNGDGNSRSIRHGGSIGGFRTDLIILPEQEIVVATLTNFSSSNPGAKANELLGVIQKDQEDDLSPAPDKKVQYLDLSIDELRQFENSYWNPRDKYTRKIYVRDDTLRYFRSEESESPLIAVAKNEFKMLGLGSTDLRVRFQSKGKKMEVIIDNDQTFLFDQFFPTSETDEEMKGYVGKFYSPELEVIYEFKWRDGQLICYHQRHGVLEELRRIKADVLDTGEFIAEFERDNDQNIISVKFTSGRVRNLHLIKTD